MRARWIALAPLSLAATLTTTAISSESEPAMTAEDLRQLCTGEDHVSRNACRIYILGVTQGIAVGVRMAGGGATGSAPCVPSGTTADALEETVKSRLGQDLARRPADRSLEASGFIGSALLAAYPCRQPR
jgi:hypothetical protein